MMAACGVALPYVGVIFGVDSGWRDLEVEQFASSSSATLTLGGEEQWDFGVGCGLMDSCRVVAPSDAMVVSIARLESGFTLIKHPGEGYAEREVEVTSGAYAQGDFSGFYQGVGDGGG
jgi:hypothetical protein